jgi:tetratricopeptide (TPR) repeat protein
MPAYLGLRGLIRAREAMAPFDPQRPVQTPQDPGRRGRLQEALRDFDRALAGNPDDDAFWHNRAWTRLQLGNNLDDAIPDLRRAVEIDGGSVCYRVSLGLILEQQGRIAEAGDQYAFALAAAPDSCDSAFARSLKSGAAPLWQAALSKAVAILRARDPEDRDVANRARLARLYFEQGQIDRARTMLETVTKAMPQFPRAWANQGRIYLASRDYARAELSLRKAVYLDAADPVVHTLFAAVAEANGDEQAADFHRERASMMASRQASPHATRLGRTSKTNAIVRDDILPPGLLAYCSPSYVATDRDAAFAAGPFGGPPDTTAHQNRLVLNGSPRARP